jgi:hypothetical protein
MALPTIVQNVSTIATSAAATITRTLTLTSGNFLWVVCHGDATMATATCADGVNTFTAVGSNGYGGSWVRHWTAPVTTGGSQTITVTPAADRTACLLVIEFGNPASGAKTEVNGTSWQNWGAGNYPASPINLSNTSIADQIVLGAAICRPGFSRDFGGNTGWTELFGDSTGTGSSFSVIYQNAASAGAYDPDFTLAAGSNQETSFAGISIIGGAGSSTKPAFYYAQL